jgi:hypothetical protein
MITLMSNSLLPCPFCGCEAGYDTDESKRLRVACCNTRCLAALPFRFRKKRLAAAGWHARPEQQQKISETKIPKWLELFLAAVLGAIAALLLQFFTQDSILFNARVEALPNITPQLKLVASRDEPDGALIREFDFSQHVRNRGFRSTNIARIDVEPASIRDPPAARIIRGDYREIPRRAEVTLVFTLRLTYKPGTEGRSSRLRFSYFDKDGKELFGNSFVDHVEGDPLEAEHSNLYKYNDPAPAEAKIPRN